MQGKAVLGLIQSDCFAVQFDSAAGEEEVAVGADEESLGAGVVSARGKGERGDRSTGQFQTDKAVAVAAGDVAGGANRSPDAFGVGVE